MAETTEVLQLLTSSYASRSVPTTETTVETINFSVTSTSNVLVASLNNLLINGNSIVTCKIYLDGTLLASASNETAQDTGADDLFPAAVDLTVADSGVASGNHSVTISLTASTSGDRSNGSASVIVSSGM